MECRKIPTWCVITENRCRRGFGCGCILILYTGQHTRTYIHTHIHAYIYIYTYFTALVTSHGKTKSYLHRFKITDSPHCPCGGKPNGRPPSIWLHHSAEGTRTTHRRDLKIQLAGKQKSARKQVHKTLHTVY